jgi:hypothetical protein
MRSFVGQSMHSPAVNQVSLTYHPHTWRLLTVRYGLGYTTVRDLIIYLVRFFDLNVINYYVDALIILTHLTVCIHTGLPVY